MNPITYKITDPEFNVVGYVRPRNPKFLPNKYELSKCIDVILSRYQIPRHRLMDIKIRMVDSLYHQIKERVTAN